MHLENITVVLLTLFFVVLGMVISTKGRNKRQVQANKYAKHTKNK